MKTLVDKIRRHTLAGTLGIKTDYQDLTDMLHLSVLSNRTRLDKRDEDETIHEVTVLEILRHINRDNVILADVMPLEGQVLKMGKSQLSDKVVYFEGLVDEKLTPNKEAILENIEEMAKIIHKNEEMCLLVEIPESKAVATAIKEADDEFREFYVNLLNNAELNTTLLIVKENKGKLDVYQVSDAKIFE